MSQLLVERNSIEKIVEEYIDMLLNIAYHNLNNTCNADDVIQEVFMKLMNVSGFNDEIHLKSWLIRVTINLCRDYNKSAWSKNTEALLEIIEPLQKKTSKIMEGVWKLPIKYRNVIYLYYFQGYLVSEIADLLNCNVNTIKSQLKRARRKLKCILVEGGYEHV